MMNVMIYIMVNGFLIVIDGLIKQKSNKEGSSFFVAFSTFKEGLQCKWREGI